MGLRPVSRLRQVSRELLRKFSARDAAPVRRLGPGWRDGRIHACARWSLAGAAWSGGSEGGGPAYGRGIDSLPCHQRGAASFDAGQHGPHDWHWWTGPYGRADPAGDVRCALVAADLNEAKLE